MLIVIPFCAKDEHLALLNLETCLKLDGGPVLFDTVLSVDTKTDVSKVQDMASQYFRSVTVVRYSPWGGDASWPAPQNWAWQSTARALAGQKDSWLWWEQDACALKKGWLVTLQGEYESGQKPFMGVWMNQNGLQYMNGVGMYPPRVNIYSKDALLSHKASFDIVLGPAIRNAFHDASHLISHTLQPQTFETMDDVKKVTQESTVLFHGCKDGSIQLALLNRMSRVGPIRKLINAILPSKAEVINESPITVVITNWKRPDKVQEAFQSCLDAGVQKIVVSASSTDSELASVHESFKRHKSDVVIDAIDEDRGNNEMWLRGVQNAKTPWVHILHDDDKILPSFGKLNPTDKIGFYHCNGAKHGVPAAKGVYDTFPGRATGIYSTDIFWPFLLAPNALTLSPVSGLFRKEHLVDVLAECETALQGEKFAYRPTLMVGNDLLIWLRAIEKYPTFQYYKEPLISYGHWDGSCSFQDSKNGHVRLKQIYAATRDYFLRAETVTNHLQFVHVYSEYDYPPRVLFARKQWLKQYTHFWKLHPVPDAMLGRLFTDGKRKLPYLKDLISHGFTSNPECNVVVFTNSDIIPCPSLTRHLAVCFQKYPCCYSYRRDTKSEQSLTEEQIHCNTTTYAGVDLFAMTRSWWDEHKDKLPDLVFAQEAWDYCLRLLMDETGGKTFYYLIYHVQHASSWDTTNTESRKYNRELAAKFLKSRGVTPYWESKTPVNMNPR